MRRRWAASVTSLVMVIGFLGGVQAVPVAAAIAPVNLPPGLRVQGIDGFTRMVVNDDKIFLAEGFTGTAVAVLTHEGVQLGSIRNIPGPGALAVQGDILYVAAYGASSVYVYDVSTWPATKTATLSTLPIASPTSLALAGGRLWFTGMDEGNGPHGSIGSMTTVGAKIDSFYPPNYEYWQYFGTCGDIDHSPFAADRLFLHGLDCGNPDVVYLYDASTAPPTRLASYGESNWGTYNSQPVTVLPDGSGMLVADDGVLRVRQLDGLSGPVDSYMAPDGVPYVGGAIATAPGVIVSGASSTGWNMVVLWAIGTTAAENAFRFAATDGRIARNGLSFGNDASALFAISKTDEKVFFHRIDPTIQGTALALVRSKGTLTFGEPLTLTATLTGGPGAGQPVQIQRKAIDGSWTAVGGCTTDGSGSCAWITTPRGKSTYRAAYAGSDGWAPSVSTLVTVEVRAAVHGRLGRSYGTSGNYHLYHEDRRVYYTAIVKPPRPGKKVWINLSANSGSGWREAGTQKFTLGPKSRVTIYLPAGSLPRGRYRLNAAYPGDMLLRYNASAWSYFKITA